MNIRVMSDLHLEFSRGEMDVPVLETDSESVLVLAGDIGLANKPYTYVPFLHNMAQRFKNVIFIMGNHEMYHDSFVRAPQKIQEQLDIHQLTNVHFGDRFTIVVDNIAFICATLWTDMNRCDPFTMFDIATKMNDFRLIRTGPPGDPHNRRLKPIDVVFEFNKSKQFIFDQIRLHQQQGHDTVVVTHHGPSFASVHEMFAHDTIMNGGYVSELSDDILDTGGPKYWIHGHTHFSFNYPIGDKTTVIVNPRGYYPNQLNPEFDPTLTLRVLDDNE